MPVRIRAWVSDVDVGSSDFAVALSPLDYVCKVLEALTKLGRWRVDRGPSGPADVAEGVSWRDVPGVGPMHKWYDPGLFDLLSREEVLETHAPQVWQGSYVSAEEAKALRARGEVVEGKDVRTAADFVQAGLPVQLVSVPGEQESTRRPPVI